MKILITGASGFIGRKLVEELLSEKHQLYILTRPQSRDACVGLFGQSSAVTYIEGDIEDTDVLSNISAVAEHIDRIDCVVHLAALYDLQASLSDSYMKNVIGTQNIINLLGKMSQVKYFHYFSTYAVNPLLKGIAKEDALVKEAYQFPDEYTRTKNDAEHLVRARTPDSVKVIIHRPGIIIGDSNTGKVDRFNGPYYFFEFIRKLKLLGPIAKRIPFIPMPLGNGSLLPVLPVNILVKWSAHIINHPPKAPFRCYHLVSQEIISTKKFLEDSIKLIGLPLKLAPIKQSKLFPHLFPILRMPTEIIFYMKQEVIFERSQLTEDYPNLQAPLYQEYLPQIIKGYLESTR